MPPLRSSARNSAKPVTPSARVRLNGSWLSLACKKKLHRFRPSPAPPHILTQRNKRCQRLQPADPESLERGVRQRLADKVNGTLVGLWLLVPEHLRLGTWDLLCGWTAQPPPSVAPRLALQLIHEAALCVRGVRQGRTLGQQGFELLNGLPFLATDQAIHQLLDASTVQQAQELQVALGLIRRARGHFRGQTLAIDPHRLKSYSQRHMRLHPLAALQDRPSKCAQTFFALDSDTLEPLCVTTGTSARTVSQASPELLRLAGRILHPQNLPQPKTLVLADCEHYTLELLDQLGQNSGFDLLVPMPNQPYYRQQWTQLPSTAFHPCWAGLALAQQSLPRPSQPPFSQLVQRTGEHPDHYQYKGFVCTAQRHGLDALITEFPKRWHIEEFFHDHQELGWQRAGTLNLNIRFGQMTLALLAQAALSELRRRLGPPYLHWQASHLARSLLGGLDGDIRVHSDTIVVTLYNSSAAETLRPHYENLPEKLQQEGIKPNIPWLYDFKLDFRFK